MSDHASAGRKPASPPPVPASAGPRTAHPLGQASPVQRLRDTSRSLNARPASVAQRALAGHPAFAGPVLPAPNRTGLPTQLKAGIEAMSGLSMDDVRVHRNSAKPAQLQAHAYAQGSDIHLAPGQERHLPHEAWHVVQQKQGRVRATMQMKTMQMTTMQMKTGVPVNDDAGLESEADRMGARAISGIASAAAETRIAQRSTGPIPVQRLVDKSILAAVKQGIGKAQLGGDGFKALRALEQDEVPRASTEATITEVKKRCALRNALLDARLRLVTILDTHDIAQTGGKRSTAQTQLLASAMRADVKVERLLDGWSYSEDDCTQAETLFAELDTLMQQASTHVPVTPQGAMIPTGSAHIVEAPWDDEPIGHLHGIKDELQAPKGDVGKTRYKAIGKLRGEDNEEPRQIGLGGDLTGKPLLKGAILYRYILNNRRAILDLVEQVGPNVALFSLERGGSFLADLISDFHQTQNPQHMLPNVKVPKSAGLKRANSQAEPTYHREQHHLALVLQMMDTEEGQAFKQMRSQIHLRAPVVRIAIAETAVSGSSVNTLLKTLTTYHHLLPYSQFDLLVEKQTIKENKLGDDQVGGLRLRDPGIQLGKNVSTSSIDKIRMFIAQTEYILGEDVGYQISYDGTLAGEPLVVFDETSHMLIAAKLSATGVLPRDLLRMLVGGALDTALSHVFH